MSSLKKLSEYAESLGAHAPLKRQLGNYDTLFVCSHEEPNEHDDSITTWEYVITIDEADGNVKIRFQNGRNSISLSTEKAKEIIRMWVQNPTDNFSIYYES